MLEREIKPGVVMVRGYVGMPAGSFFALKLLVSQRNLKNMRVSTLDAAHY